MTARDTKELLKRYLEGDCSQEEKAWVESWYLDQTDKAKIPSNSIDYHLKETEIWDKIPALQIGRPQPKQLWPQLSVAAMLLVALTAGVYFLRLSQKTNSVNINQVADLQPGSNKAILTLANGTKVVLNQAPAGQIITQGDVAITKSSKGRLIYQSSPTADDHQPVLYNTISTPKGGQYSVTLADGTKVLLNAASTLKYPTAFRGSERLVELSGEAYFEVVHNPKSPFMVKAGPQYVQDVGTRFDVKAYADEPALTTTLLEGEANVFLPDATESAVNLKPNQQTQLKSGKLHKITDADVELTTGWIDGHFRFKNASLKEVMQELARWYDVEVVYEGILPNDLFTGNIHRNIKASQALEILTFFKVHYQIQNKKIIITP